MKKILIPLISIFIIYLFYLFIRASDNPSYCNSCHIMKPYYNNWVSSSHAGVNCTKCHYKKGFLGYIEGKLRLLAENIRYLAGVYHVKLHSKIDDENCMDCHIKEELEAGEILFAKRIKFKHIKHYDKEIRGIKLSCQSCHSELIQGEHTAVNKNVCIFCHFIGKEAKEPIGGCEICHGPPREVILIRGIKFSHLKYEEAKIDCRTCHIYVTEGSGGVSSQKCSECHIEKEIEYKDHKFLHNVHVSKEKIKCEICHEIIKHKRVEMAYALSPKCEECHGGKHSLQEKIYIGIGAIDVPVTPDPMFLSGVSCIGCHQVKEERFILGHKSIFTVASPKVCNDCHGKGYDKLLFIWKKGVKDRIEEIGEKVNRFYKISNFIKVFYDPQIIKENFDFIKEDKTYGIHNIKYVHLILNRIEEEIDKGEKNIFKLNKRKISLENLFERDPECLSCHFGIENQKVKIGEKIFNHYNHLYENSCFLCHSKEKHGFTYKNSYDCNSCHHKNENCKKCHEIQSKIYNGEFYNFSKDPMNEAGIGCTDCHKKEGIIKKNFQNFCVDCHEEDYEKDFISKKEKIKNLIYEIEKIFKEKENKIEDQKLIEFLKIYYEFNEFKKDKSFGAHNFLNYEDYLLNIKEKIEKF